MSTAILKANNSRSQEVGFSYDATKQLIVKPNLTENQYTKVFNPVSGTVGSNHVVEVNLSPNDLFALNECYLEFNVANNDATLSFTILNPWLLFSEMRLLMNGQEVLYFDNADKLFACVAMHYRQFSHNELFNELQKIRATELSETFNGETIAPLASRKFSLPLLGVLFPFMHGMSRANGLIKFSFEFRFQPNTNTASTVGRFIKSSTTNNPYTLSTIAFQQVSLRLLATRHSDTTFYSVPKPVMIIPKYDDRVYSLAWNATTDSQRIQLTNDFTFRSMCHGILVYLYPQSNVTAYNDADCCLVHSRLGLIGWELKYKSRTVLKMDSANDNQMKVQYYHRVNELRYGKTVNRTLISDDGTSPSAGTLFVPLTFIDLQGIEFDSDTEAVYSGISNAGGELELILTNNLGAFSTSAYLHVVLCYYEGCTVDAKSGMVTYKRDLYH
jgi:hypothetical protein